MKKGLILLISLCFVFSIGLHSEALAATYYVDAVGSDSNPGSQAKPWQTIQHAAKTVQAGDTVLVNNGTYKGFDTRKSGTVSNPITFKANGSSVIINSKNKRTPDNINVENADYTIIDGFIISNAPRAGIRVAESKGVVVKNNKVGPNGKWGIFTGFTIDLQILNNITFGSKGEHGIYVSNSRVKNDNPIIRNNESYGNRTNGIQINGDCKTKGDGVIDGAIIENNKVYENGYKGLSLISMTDSVVRNNLIYNNGTRGRGAGGVHLTDEPGCGKPSSNNLFVNNTIIEPTIAAIRITDAAANNIFFNNLLISKSNYYTYADEVGDSSFDKKSNIRLASTEGLFVNPSKGDYHLASGSPAINTGSVSFSGKNAPKIDIQGINRPIGPSIDIGAYEYNGKDAESFVGLVENSSGSGCSCSPSAANAAFDPFPMSIILIAFLWKKI